MPLELAGTTYFQLQEVADLVGVHRHTIRRWANEGRVPPGQRYPKQKARVFTEVEVEAIRAYANRMDPAIAGDPSQFEIFRLGNGGRQNE